VNFRRTLGWIAPLALALLAAASVVLVPATPAAAAGAAPITVPFDHLTTGVELDGVHRDLPCESCHLNAVFRGTPRDCGTCHIKGSLFNATPKTTTHIPSTNNCAACHNTISFRPDMHFSHAEVMGSCVSCHNGTIATGMTIPPHPKTNQNCAACHSVISWNPPSMVDHTQIPLAVAGFCIICHNGKDADGKNAGHIATSLECGDCHLTTTWLGANFDHTGITTGCASCHNGTKAVGKQGNHMPTTNLCEDCHTTGIGTKNPSWVPSKFDHTQMTVTTCETCHSGTVKISTGFVSGKPSNHVPTVAGAGDCSVCHGNTPTAETWTVLAASISVLHTGLPVTNCLLCHGGQTFAGVPAPYIPMSMSGVSPTKKAPLAPPHIPVLTGTDCSACHGAAYQAGGFGPATAMSAATHKFVSSTCDTCHETGKSFYVGSGTPLQLRPANHVNSTDPGMAKGDCSGCHNTSDWTSKTMPAGHMPNPSNLPCATCHASAPNDYSPATLAANSKLHTGIAGNCGLCHGDTVTALTWANNYTPKDAMLTPSHIPYLSGTDCSSCHSSTTYAAGTFGPMNMTQAKHAFVPTACNTCHEAGLSFYMGAANPALQGRPADHTSGQMVAPNDCDMCHTTANWNSTALPAGHMPNPANQACTVCHTSAPSVYTQPTLASNAVLHTGITGNCSQCHGATTALTWFNNFTPKDAVLTPRHIPYIAGTDCGSCHSSGTYAVGTFGPMNMTPAKHAFAATTCNTCHEAGLSFYMGAASPALQGRPADHTGALAAPADCSGCHTTANWNSSILPAGHMPNPAALNCTVCHTQAPTTYTQPTLAANSVLHTGIAGNCGQCHGAMTALTWYNNFTPKDAILTPAHIPYTSGTDCSSCHTSSTYAAGTFGPTNMTAAKHAYVPTTCVTCHETGSNFYLGASTPNTLQVRPADHIASGDAQQKTGDCSICHTPASWASNTLPIGHMPNPGNQACATCHTAITGTFASYATLTTNMAVMHTGIAGGCAQCHGASSQLTFYNNNLNPKAAVLTPPHMPYLSGTDCSSCHVVAATFGPTAMSAAKHAFVATACNSCHGATTTTPFYMGASTPILQLRPADHTQGQQATGDCSGCHNTTNWTSTVMPTGHMPNPGNQACATCHTAAPTNYATMATVAVLHTGISGNCALCHGGTTGTLSFYNNNDIPKAAAGLAPSHIPYLVGTDCSSCHTANYVAGGFGPATAMSPAKHAFVPTTCDTCHDTGKSFYVGSGTALQLRPASHISAPNPATQATADCSACHTTTDWNAPTTLPNGHMPIPGTQTCTVCHTSAPGNYNAYATLPILHTGITTGCAQCHGGAAPLTFYNGHDNPKAAPSNHIPSFTGNDCSACHKANYVAGGFGPMNMTQATHVNVSTTACKTCHERGLTFYMGAANPGLQGRPVDHTAVNMATDDCSVCHTTANWLSTVAPAGHMPNPANIACNVCHTAAPANYVTLAANSVLHTGISGGCVQCHGATQLTFYNNNDNPKPQVANHIPYLAGTDCGSCHKTTTYATGTFGPMNMTQATHAFVSTTCNTCHASTAGSLYMGAASPALQLRPADHTAGQMLTGDCSACHTTANWNSTTLPAGHMPNPANQGCAVCHTASPANYTTLAANAVMHTGISGNCGQCHGAATALTWYNQFTPKYTGSLTPKHIPYTSGTDCSSCHSSSTYAVGTFGPMNMTQAKHAFVPTTCNTCHEAGLSFYMGSANPALQGRPADHTAANQAAPNDCRGCHTTANWSSNTMPAGHMPNPANTACNTCHTGATATPPNYALLAANSVLHTGITGNCIQCHGATQLSFYNNNDNPKPQVAKHIPYLAGTDCGSCHKTTTYAAGTFGPMNMTQATHAFVTTTCNTCHASAAGSLYMGAASPALQLRPADHSSGTMLTGDCSGCHTTANWNSTALPSGHMPNPGNQTCNACHTSAPTNYKVFASNAVLHTGITGNCSQCHGATTQLSFYNNDMVIKAAVLTPAHIPYLSGTDCSSCHKSTTYAAGTFGPMNMTQATHAFVSTTCKTCHGTATVAFYIGAANPKLQLRPADHTSGTMLTGDCGGCHTTANWNSTALPTGHMPNPGNQACATCHTAAPANYTTLATNAVLHTGIASGCITCHGAPNVTKPVFYLNFSPKAASGLSPVHIPTASTACESCHAISFTAFSGTTMSAAKHTAMLAATGGTCDQCHDLKTLTFYGVTNLTTRPSGHHVGQDCKGCHSPNNWGGNAQKRTVAAAKTPTKSTIGTVVGAPAARPASAFQGPGSGRVLGDLRDRPGLAQSGIALGAANHSVSHAGVTGNCASCHNGVLAAGKSAAHIASNNSCQNCHTIIAWLPARFDHQGVTAKCVSCHNGVVALGKPTLHLQTNQDCGACHGTLTWTAVMFSHVGINAACQSCHNGITATGKQVQHVRTTLDCASCHNTLNWTVVSVQPKPSAPATPRPAKPIPRPATGGPAR